MTSRESTPTERTDFMQTDGCALYTDVNDLLLKYLDTVPLRPLSEFVPYHHCAELRENPAGSALMFTALRLTDPIPQDTEAFCRQFGIDAKDINQSGQFTFRNGLNDLRFPWYFSAGVANAAVDVCVVHDALSQEQKGTFTLTDWADIIESKWLARLVHLLAVTRNGLYLGFGSYVKNYKLGAFEQLLHESRIAYGQPILEYSETNEDGQPAPAVTLSKPAIKDLRKALGNDPRGSVGCPVARLAMSLPKEMTETNRHVRALVERDTFHAVPGNPAAAVIRFTQEQTAISKTLTHFGGQLRQYDARFGTPRFIGGNDAKFIEHRREANIGIFAAHQTSEAGL